MRRYLRVTLHLAIILSTLASTAHAERRLKDHLGGSRALPPAGERIAFAEKAETEEPSDPNSLLKDPQMLVRFIKANPSRLSVDAMNPALVLTITRVLIDGGALFIAERLLSEAGKNGPTGRISSVNTAEC